MEIIIFACYDSHTLPTFAESNIIKFSDIISLCNCFFIYKHLIRKSPSAFHIFFILASNTHELKHLTKPTHNTSNYGNNAFAAFAKASKNFF